MYETKKKLLLSRKRKRLAKKKKYPKCVFVEEFADMKVIQKMFMLKLHKNILSCKNTDIKLMKKKKRKR